MTIWLAGGILLSAIFWAAFVHLKRRFGASASQGWAAATPLVPALAIPALADLAFAANLGLGLWGDEAPRFQLGEHFTLSGAPALALLLMVFVLPFLLFAVWCVRRLSRAS